MKKYLGTLIILITLGIGGYFVIGLFNVKPPSPSITVEDKKVEVAQGSHCWDGLINAGCVDMTSPPELIKFHELKPVVVSPESELKIEFKNTPQENTLNVNQWLTNEKTENVQVKDNRIVLPKEKGVYAYDVSARWEKGDSSYAFVVEIR
jgi:hypothetical protein